MSLSPEILSQSLIEVRDQILQKNFTIEALTELTLQYIDHENHKFNAFVYLDHEGALTLAKELDDELKEGKIRGPLHGVPISIKDNIFTHLMPTTMGSPIFKDFVPKVDAYVVEQLKAAGAIILGKTNTHQFAYGATGDRSLTGATKHAFDPTRFPGGSSSGSAVAVARCMGYGSLGTDTGGSVRIPSAFNQTVGMKPTYGAVSNNYVYPLAPTLDHVGPITRTVRDNALLLEVIANEHSSATPRHTIDRNYSAKIGEELSGIRIGVPQNDYFRQIDGEILRIYQETIQILSDLGADIIPILYPEPDNTRTAFWETMKAEAYTVHRENIEEFGPEMWDEEVLERVLSGKGSDASDYILAQELKRGGLYPEFEALFKETDLIITPTTPLLPQKLDERYVSFDGEKIHVKELLNKFTGLTNFSGLPSLSFPAGIASYEEVYLPVGVQLIGNYYEEALIYQVAAAFEDHRLKG